MHSFWRLVKTEKGSSCCRSVLGSGLPVVCVMKISLLFGGLVSDMSWIESILELYLDVYPQVP